MGTPLNILCAFTRYWNDVKSGIVPFRQAEIPSSAIHEPPIVERTCRIIRIGFNYELLL